MKKLIMGLGGSAHDFSTVIMEDNNVLCGIEDERITKRKHGLAWWYEMPCRASSNYCLDQIQRCFSEIDHIVTSDIMPNRIKKYFPNVIFYNHHLLHAASTYYFTNLENIAIVVVDGWGSVIKQMDGVRIRETISVFHCNNNNIQLIGRTVGEQPIEENSFSMGISNSLGYFYNLITRILGFGKLEEGKTMGLIGYGSPKYFDLMMQHIKIGNSIEDSFIFKPFDEGLITELSKLVTKHANSFQVKADIAASGQLVFEKALFNLINLILEKKIENIGISGGCGLNGVVNGQIFDFLSDKNKKLVIFPHVSDAGIAFGAAAYESQKNLPKKLTIRIKGDSNRYKVFSVAKEYLQNEILEAINQYYPQIEYEVAKKPEKKIAALLFNGEIVAIYRGSSEFGPRALGNRSLLANPTCAHFREVLNRKVKHREPFRPIAPIVLDKYYSEFFDGNPDRPFMLQVAKVKKDKIDLIGSVVHIDGTARVQTVYEELNPLLYKILEEFYLLSGVPILSNTSFNLKGQPIVESPVDALASFLQMPIQYLYMDGYLVNKLGTMRLT